MNFVTVLHCQIQLEHNRNHFLISWLIGRIGFCNNNRNSDQIQSEPRGGWTDTGTCSWMHTIRNISSPDARYAICQIWWRPTWPGFTCRAKISVDLTQVVVWRVVVVADDDAMW